MSVARRRRLAVLVAALLASSQVGAQPPPRAILLGVGGQHASVVLTFAEREHRLEVELAATDLPPGRPFALHFNDDRPCPTMPRAPAAARSIVPDVPALRADEHGRLYRRFTLDGLTLRAGPGSIAEAPAAVYATAEDGGARLACGPVAPEGFVTTTQRPPPVASLDDARACMDSEDRIVRLDHRREADHARVDAARTADERFDAAQVEAAHQSQFDAYLKTHDQACGKLRIDARERAAVLAERAAAASAAR